MHRSRTTARAATRLRSRPPGCDAGLPTDAGVAPWEAGDSGPAELKAAVLRRSPTLAARRKNCAAIGALARSGAGPEARRNPCAAGTGVTGADRREIGLKRMALLPGRRLSY